ncbi:MAG: zf-HC2 domain-containing protein [Candidatus Acidiferrales bacterium]
MVVKCEEVLREISNYVDGDIAPSLKAALDEHFANCRKCVAVRDGMRNVVALYGDERMFPLPKGYFPRLHSRIAYQAVGQRGSTFGWMVTLAATAAVAASFLVAAARGRNFPAPRSAMSQPTRHLPEVLVAVVAGGKMYHHPGCEFMHGQYRLMPAEEAVREGYSPCIRCMKEALRSAARGATELEGEQLAETSRATK